MRIPGSLRRPAAWIGLPALLLAAVPAAGQDITAVTTVHAFSNVQNRYAYPQCRLVLANNGLLYGTSSNWDNGYIYKIDPSTTPPAVTTVFNFDGTRGSQPYSGLIKGAGASTLLYGTTWSGGTNGQGTVFSIDTVTNAVVVLHNFKGGSTDGANSQSQLLLGSDGMLYGTTYYGGVYGNGTIFKVDPTKTDTPSPNVTVLHSFQYGVPTDGYQLIYGLIEMPAPDGRLIGETYSGGEFNYGTVYAINKNGTGFTLLRSFSNVWPIDGRYPYGEPVLGPDGNLWGTTSYGGANDLGTLWSMSPDGSTFTNLFSFDGESGANPTAGLSLSYDGATLFGTTHYGGYYGYGATVQVDPVAGTVTPIVSFTGDDANYTLEPPTQLSDTRLFGASYFGGAANLDNNNGTGSLYVETFDPVAATWSSARILSFGIYADGYGPRNGLVQTPAPPADDGLFYGVTQYGGTYGNGVIFSTDSAGAAYSLVHSFDNGAGKWEGYYPVSLVQTGTGTFQGTCAYGGRYGYGTLWQYSSATGVLKVLHYFTYAEGYQSYGRPLVGADGKVYGVGYSGGLWGRGTVWQFNPATGRLAVLHDFTTSDGANPLGGLVQNGAGTLFGTTAYSGPGGYGTVYKIAPSGVGFATLFSFTPAAAEGYYPYGGLTLDAATGKLWGVTAAVSGGGGALYWIDPSTTPAGHGKLYTFNSGTDGSNSYTTPLRDASGNWYGTSTSGAPFGWGSAWKISSAGVFTSLGAFTGPTGTAPGGNPYSDLIPGADGKFYGMTNQSGPNGGGTLFGAGP